MTYIQYLARNYIRLVNNSEHRFYSVTSLSVIVFASFLNQSSFAQSAEEIAFCQVIISDASHDIRTNRGARSFLKSVFDNYCEEKGSVKNSSGSVGAAFPIAEIPIDFKIGTSNASQIHEKFCKQFSESVTQTAQTDEYVSSVVDSSIRSAIECLDIAKGGSRIRHRFQGDEQAVITITPPSGRSLTLLKLTRSENLTCDIGNPNGKSITLQNETDAIKIGTINGITCIRQAAKTDGDTQNQAIVYEPATVTMITDDGSYGFTWPGNKYYSVLDSNTIRDHITKLSEGLNAVRSAQSVIQRTSDAAPNDGKDPDDRRQRIAHCDKGLPIGGFCEVERGTDYYLQNSGIKGKDYVCVWNREFQRGDQGIGTVFCDLSRQ